MIRVLFVCHGNICRSTMAEFVLKDMVLKKNMSNDFVIDSAGTSSEELGSDTHYGTKEKLRYEKIPFTKRRARKVTVSDYNDFDYLICMDSNNVRNLLRIIGEDSQKKVSLLLDFSGEGNSIADPWYTGDFNTTYNDIVRGCNAFLKKMQNKGGNDFA